MSFERLHKLVAYLLSGLGLVALSLGTELESSVLVLMFAGYAGSFFAEGKLLERPYYAKGWTASVAGMLAFQFLRALAAEPTLAMAMEFAAYLQISRLWNRRSAADYQQIAVLSFLHLIAATVLSTSLSYALVFVGFVVVTPWMLALSQLRREIEGNYPSGADADEKAKAAVQRVLASKRVVGASFLASTALLAVPLFAMTLAIFVVVPRVGQGFLSLQRNQGQRVTGFGNQIELGDFGVIRDDPTVVLRVTPLPRTDDKAPRLSLRLRGTSFDRYDGRRWTRSPGGTIPMRRFGANDVPIRRAPERQRDKEFQVVLDHLDEPVVFLPEGTVAVNVAPRIVQGEQIPRRLVQSSGFDVRYTDPDEMGLVYTAVVSLDPAEQDVPRSRLDRRVNYLQMPKGHERITRFTGELVKDAKGPAEIAGRILEYLHSPQFTYSLVQPEVGSKLPLDVFLFEQKRGHCEYFASAMAVMLRTQGVPSRNVTGFVGGRYNPYGGYYALRQGDAHSWVEAFIGGRWVSYDPTPPARAQMGPRQSVWADLQALVDALRMRWMMSVVGYDLRTQVSMLRKLARLFSSHDQAKVGPRDSLRVSDGSWKNVAPKLLVGGAIVGLVFVVVSLRRRLHRARRARPVTREVAEAQKLYRELERALSRQGLARPAAVTPAEHARALSAQGFSCSREVQEVTLRYIQVRYGGEALAPSELTRLRSAIARVAAAERQPEARARL